MTKFSIVAQRASRVDNFTPYRYHRYHNCSISVNRMSTPSAYFDENAKWNLLGYLKYREKAEDFSMDKAIEHRNYLKDLEHILSTTESGGCHEQAAVCISNFQAQ